MKILIRNSNTNKIEKVSEQDYKNESEIQKLILKNPDVIPFEEIEDGIEVVKFIDEFGIPNSGSSDLVGVDNNANIYIIECKLASNAEIKRKVIGQILEYASFIWGMDFKEFNNKFIQKTNQSVSSLILEESHEPQDENDFNDILSENLINGNFKLLIIVDKINDTLKRTIDFINSASNKNYEIIILEISLFKNENAEIYIPKLFGIKPPPITNIKIWDEDLFTNEIKKKLSEFEVNTLKQIVKFTKLNSYQYKWGRGRQTGSFTYYDKFNEKTFSIFSIFSNGKIWLSLPQIKQYLGDKPLTQFLDNLKNKMERFKIFEEFYSGKKWPEYFIKDIFLNENDLNVFLEIVKTLKK